MTKYQRLRIHFLFITIVFAAGCTEQQTAATSPPADRESKRPADIIKVTPQTDLQPPNAVSLVYRNPGPIPGAVNTARVEDSPFILPDGNTRSLFFTPDGRVPVEKQITEGVTGIWVSKKTNGNGQQPERGMLQEARKLSLGGGGFVSGYTMWFCAARGGGLGTNWKNANFALTSRWANCTSTAMICTTVRTERGEKAGSISGLGFPEGERATAAARERRSSQ